ncbi:phosphoenolpyruvate carboxykinase [Methylocystis echinoides]|uniref:Phosphoenolpyruvate carboxykinase (ATP) n=1 Tax=Methylocystis echinoides TaxID=29468 RepID=A0A9W6GSD5_9HYPH|nr:phosphoenolpyruvate carboxykinase [Methylocystis echinoides]GLI92035.1 phosphoenolpyruvate carboxykinase [ATP] [Methylocystis echinoides]
MTAQMRVAAERPIDVSPLHELRPAFLNLDTPRLYEEAIRRGEAAIAQSGALVVDTAPHTGRSPADKFIVRDAETDPVVWWENNQPMTPDHFARLYADMLTHARALPLFAQDLHGCADPGRRQHIRVYSEYAWHSLFIRTLLIRSGAPSGTAPDFTIIDLPSFRANPKHHGCRSQTVIALDFTRRLALIGGTRYAGEIKKAVFTFLNFLMPASGVLPMHCAVNDHESGAAVFFGLSGTGKTTLSADPDRVLVGDDEHGWGDRGLFNFEGGCYAKAIRLSAQFEPEIYGAAQRFGAVLENVGFDPVTRCVDFDDDSKTENTRIAYPLEFIANAAPSGCAGHPRNIVMLTCDAFGVLPPIARLDPSQAMYHFLSGYTARVAGTETGVSEPQAVFSTCFGAPFMPRHPGEYGAMLRERILRHEATCWLVNTGWTGGAYGVGRRMPIALTRALLRAALQGALSGAAFRKDPYFRVDVPVSAPGVDAPLLDPAATWASRADYDATAGKVVDLFTENFAGLAPFVDHDVRAAAPCRP